jgi:hypothetical protein
MKEIYLQNQEQSEASDIPKRTAYPEPSNPAMPMQAAVIQRPLAEVALQYEPINPSTAEASTELPSEPPEPTAKQGTNEMAIVSNTAETGDNPESLAANHHALLTELSVITFAQQARLQQSVVDIKGAVMQTYAPFMSEASKAIASGINDTVIVTTAEDFESLDEHLSPSIASTSKTSGVISYRDQNIIALEDTGDHWDAPSTDRAGVIEWYGSEAEGRAEMHHLHLDRNLIHEAVSQLSPDSELPVVLPPDFVKIGASYYQWRTNNQLERDSVAFRQDHAHRAIFSCALEDFGDDVHRVFFGQEVDSERAEKIIQTVTDHAAEYDIGEAADIERVALQQNVQYDDLRIEISESSPQMQTKLERTVANAKRIIFDELAAYIPEETMQSTIGLESQVILTSGDILKDFYEGWSNEDATEELLGAAFPYPGGIIIKNPPIEWDTLPDEYKAEYAQWEGSEQAAHEAFDEANILYLALHETVHHFHGKSLSPVIKELGVNYFTEKLMRELCADNYRYAPLPADAPYKNALDRFGDDVHRVFFGQEVDSEQEAAVIQFIYDEAANDPVGRLIAETYSKRS